MTEGDWVQMHNVVVAGLALLAFALGYLAGYGK